MTRSKFLSNWLTFVKLPQIVCWRYLIISAEEFYVLINVQPIEICKKNERQKKKNHDLGLKLQNFLELNSIIYYYHNKNHDNWRTVKFNEKTCIEDVGLLQLLSGVSRAAVSPWHTQRSKPNDPWLKYKSRVCGQAAGAFLNPTWHHKVAGKWDKTKKCTDILSFQVFSRIEGNLWTISGLAS